MYSHKPPRKYGAIIPLFKLPYKNIENSKNNKKEKEKPKYFQK